MNSYNNISAENKEKIVDFLFYFCKIEDYLFFKTAKNKIPKNYEEKIKITHQKFEKSCNLFNNNFVQEDKNFLDKCKNNKIIENEDFYFFYFGIEKEAKQKFIKNLIELGWIRNRIVHFSKIDLSNWSNDKNGIMYLFDWFKIGYEDDEEEWIEIAEQFEEVITSIISFNKETYLYEICLTNKFILLENIKYESIFDFLIDYLKDCFIIITKY